MMNLKEANIGDTFIVLEIHASDATKIFLSTLGIEVNSEFIIRGDGYLPNTLLIDIDGRIIQLDYITISQIKGEVVKVKKLIK